MAAVKIKPGTPEYRALMAKRGKPTLAQAQEAASVPSAKEFLNPAKTKKKVQQALAAKGLTGKPTRSGTESIDVFNAAIDKFGNEEVPEWHLQMSKDFTSRLFLGIFSKTPFLTGRAQNNWQVTLGAPSNASIPGPPWPDTLQNGFTVINRMKRFQDSFISNNVSYIADLENGWSDKAPQGMVAVTLAEVSAQMGGYVDALDNAMSLSDPDSDQLRGLGGSL
jgi:hypothetical protein